MSVSLKLRAKAAAKRGEAQKILTAIEAEPITRGMTPEEQGRFDGLMAENATLKAQAAAAKALEADEDADEAEEVAVPAERSVRRSKPPGEAPAAHTEIRRYSYHRALRLASDKQPLDGLEGELSQEIALRRGAKPKGFFMPTGQDPILRDLAMGRRSGATATMREMHAERRDLTTGTGAGAIFTVPEMPLIELLRAKLVIRMLGAKILTDMQGLFAIPRQTGKATVYWPSPEGTAGTLSNPSVDQVAFTPKLAVAAVNIDRQFMNQSSLNAEQFTLDDLSESMAREFDRVAINGGVGAEPIGLLQNSTIQTNSAGLAAAGGNGGVPTFATVVGLESQVAGFNADNGKLAYLTNPKLRGTLKQTPKIAASPSFPEFIWKNTQEVGVGEVNGYPAHATTNVPSNLTKGSVSALSAMIFGDWSQLICAMWEGVDTLVNPYTNQLAGSVIVSNYMSVDVRVRHEESFAIVTDAHL